MTFDEETGIRWKVDQARSDSERIIDALVKGTNESFKEIGEEDEATALVALMAAIEQKIFLNPNGQPSVPAVIGTLATAILQLARVERGVPRVTPVPQLD